MTLLANLFRRTVPTSCLSAIGSFGVLTILLSAGSARAGDPRIGQLHHEIEQLRHQEKETIKSIEAHYDSIIHKDKMSEKELEHKRHELKEEEERMLAHAQTHEQREQIRKHFDEMRHHLSHDVHMDAEQIKHLREARNHHVEHIKHVFHEKIHHLEEEIKALEHEHHKK
jgi:hypothetical protein